MSFSSLSLYDTHCPGFPRIELLFPYFDRPERLLGLPVSSLSLISTGNRNLLYILLIHFSRLDIEWLSKLRPLNASRSSHL
jgi:hypothetical protein